MRPLKILWVAASLMLANTAIAGMQEITASNSQIGFQAISLNMDYAEKNNTGTLLDTETGPISGTTMSFSNMWGRNNLYLQLLYSLNEGRTKYVGGYLSPPTPYGSVVSTSGATVTNYSIRFGKGFELSRTGTSYMLTPYLEYGSQRWVRGVNLGETYSHNSLGAGLLWQISPADSKLVISVNGMVGNTTNAYINVVGYFAGPLGNSPLYKAGLNFDYALSSVIHVNAGVDYASFTYGKSAVYSGYYEPDSTSNYMIYKAGVGIAF